MPESLMVIRSSSTLRKHWEWMTFSADSVSSVHTLTDDLPLESLADQARKLLDDELLENNPRDQYLSDLKADIED